MYTTWSNQFQDVNDPRLYASGASAAHPARDTAYSPATRTALEAALNRAVATAQRIDPKRESTWDRCWNQLWNSKMQTNSFTVVSSSASTTCGRDRRRGNDNGARWLMGIVGAVVALGASVTLGSNISSYRQANRTIRAIREQDKEAVRDFSRSQADAEAARSLRRLVNVHEAICKREKKNCLLNLAGSISILAAAIIGVVGALVGSTLLMVAASITALATACGLLVKWGMAYPQNENEADRAILLNSVARFSP